MKDSYARTMEVDRTRKVWAPICSLEHVHGHVAALCVRLGLGQHLKMGSQLNFRNSRGTPNGRESTKLMGNHSQTRPRGLLGTLKSIRYVSYVHANTGFSSGSQRIDGIPVDGTMFLAYRRSFDQGHYYAVVWYVFGFVRPIFLDC